MQHTEQRKLAALVFTDMVGSTQLKQDLGDREGLALIQRHHAVVRELLGQFKEGEEISTAGDSFFLVFATPSDAVTFALRLQTRLRAMATATRRPVADRIGIHVGEVFIEPGEGSAKPKDLHGIHVDTCSRVTSLAQGDQILMTRFAFDNGRSVLKGGDIEGVGPLSWLNHGPYELKGVEEPLEICEVGEAGKGALTPPTTSEKARRHVADDSEPVLGWRPALEQKVPGTEWVLERKLGEGGFGEVWLGRHEKLKDRRVFKFCFRADRVRSLKREVTLFRVMKERVGHHPNIVGIQEVFFDTPPFYIVMDYAEAEDLRAWCEKQGFENIPVATRLEIVAQAADALQAAHAAGVIHRDVKPSNILISEIPKSDIRNPHVIRVKLTDFGIGQVVSQEALAGLTRLGFTQTMLSPGASAQTGTHLYMAPELLAGKPASTRSDIYSLGVVLYQILVGDFTRPLTTDWARKITDPLLRADLEQCFAGDPEERFASAGELANRLRSLEQRRSVRVAREKAVRSRRIVRQGAVAALVAGVFTILAIYAFKQRGSNPTQGAFSVTNSVEVAGTKDPRAYDSYRRGKSDLFSNTGLAGLTDAVKWFNEAIKLDPEYARAYADLAYTYRLLDMFHKPATGLDAKAWEATNKALVLEPRLADAYVVRGALFFTPAKQWNAERAIGDQQEAIRLDPTIKNAHYELAFVYNHLGFLEEAVTELDKELTTHPMDPTPLWLKGSILMFEGKYAEALEFLGTVPEEAFPHPRSAGYNKAMCLFYLGRTTDAADLLEDVLKNVPGDSLLISMQAILHAAGGEPEKARDKIRIAEMNDKHFGHSHHIAYDIASAYALMQEDRSAMDWLKRAADDGFPCYVCFEKDTNLNNLRGDPSFRDFMEEQRTRHERYKALLKP